MKKHVTQEEADKADIVIVNGKAKCGCEVHISDGHGEYSNVVYIWFCDKHSCKKE